MFPKNYIAHTPKGQLGAVFIIMIVIVGMLAGALAVDLCHMLAVRNELQNATDAGALAGAQDLWNNVQHAELDALEITGRNTADGVYVKSTSPRVTTVHCVVTPPQGNTPGIVEVSATIQIRHLFAPFFFRYGDTVSATSVASTAGQLWLLNANQAFPIAVSIDAIPATKTWTGRALSTYSIGDTFTLYLGSQSVKNAAFTSFNHNAASASYITDAISQALGLSPEIPGFIPSLKIGDLMNLNNGIAGQKHLAKDPLISALKAQPYIVLPIMSGPAAYNQTRAILGFTAMRVTNVSIDNNDKVIESITGTLVKPQVLGVSGPFPTDGTPYGANIERLNLGPIQLVR